MLWLMIVLFASLGALLFTVASMTRHILLQRKRLRAGRLAAARSDLGPEGDSFEESDVESKL